MSNKTKQLIKDLKSIYEPPFTAEELIDKMKQDNPDFKHSFVKPQDNVEKKMLKKLKPLISEVADYLGLEEVLLDFDSEMIDDSRLYTKYRIKISINSKYKDNYIECAKSIVHEYRHLYQITYVALMNDARAARWKEELSIAKTGNEVGYEMQELELDAFAFTEKILKEKYGIEVKHPNAEYQKLIDLYIIKYGEIL